MKTSVFIKLAMPGHALLWLSLPVLPHFHLKLLDALLPLREYDDLSLFLENEKKNNEK
ncbi:hypothetical protein B7P43_G10063 [Cryptotermes secundus]|uniref:Uncharacterized protein n=1 Tax=Cryptotermes secundus TaxID=105785 RepID=A0A2J7QRY6_9NEOP|nr:hypothetical protein B7P43_G10063 [Cryptotermes secundus]